MLKIRFSKRVRLVATTTLLAQNWLDAVNLRNATRDKGLLTSFVHAGLQNFDSHDIPSIFPLR